MLASLEMPKDKAQQPLRVSASYTLPESRAAGQVGSGWFGRRFDDRRTQRSFSGSGGPRSFRPFSIMYLYALRLLPADSSPGNSSAALQYAARAPARSPVWPSA